MKMIQRVIMRMVCSAFLSIGLVLGVARPGLAQQPCVQDTSKSRVIVVGPGGGGIIGLPTDNHPGRTPPPPPCKAPDYVGQASEDLLAGIKLTKAQSDSAKKLERAAKQSVDTAIAAVLRARGESGVTSEPSRVHR